ncbi:MAG: hypothetical protein CMN91_01660 [Synechococcus sp. ARS1019]|nr:hypothetical protein [Synechococcus sp. ARS1019]|tara:strand:+ start:62 stop:358 length:297 start_codon:yes stop_codon:yes gene_type:complete
MEIPERFEYRKNEQILTQIGSPQADESSVLETKKRHWTGSREGCGRTASIGRTPGGHHCKKQSNRKSISLCCNFGRQEKATFAAVWRASIQEMERLGR